MINESKALAPRRGYSREFTRPPGDPGARYMLDGIPSALWSAAQSRSALSGESVRAILLRALEGWTAGRLALRSRRPKVAAAGRRGARPQRRPCSVFVPSAPGSVLWDVQLYGRRRSGEDPRVYRYRVAAPDYAAATVIAGGYLATYTIEAVKAAGLVAVPVCARCACVPEIHDAR